MRFGFQEYSNRGADSLEVSDLESIEELALTIDDLKWKLERTEEGNPSRFSHVVVTYDPNSPCRVLDIVDARDLCRREHLIPLARLVDFMPADGEPYCDLLVLLLDKNGVQALKADDTLSQAIILAIAKGGYLVVYPVDQSAAPCDTNAEQPLVSFDLPGSGLECVRKGNLAIWRRVERSHRFYQQRSIYRQPRAAILNDHLKTFGGGERSTLQFARAFEELGFKVDIVTAHPSGTALEDLSAVFNIKPIHDWRLREFSSNSELSNRLFVEGYEIFLNHSFGSMIAAPVPLSFYMVMFPHWIEPSEWQAIASYRRVIANSAFTATHIRERWSKLLEPAVMIPPPHALAKRVRLEKKEKLILNVGRFNIRGHNKHQLEVIRSFCDFQGEGIIPADWKLVVVGNVNDSLDNRQYVAQCRVEGSRGNVEIIENASFEVLESFYERATALLQFTGCDQDWGRHPEQCEHLGLVALDCFSYGVLPIIYQRSGMSYIIDHGSDGFLFGQLDELRSILSEIVEWFHGEYHRRVFDRCQAKADYYAEPVFRDHLERLIMSASREVRNGISISS